MKPTETALIVPLPEAEEAVGPFRASLDTAAAGGVPAHVTVLYPFLPPERIDHEVLATVSQAIRAIPRFDVALTHVEWFGAEIVWLAPRPDRPFRDLTNAVWQRFPDNPPYAGAYPDPAPHLTVGHDAERRLLDHAAEAVSAHLPVRATVEAVRLICGSEEPGSWHTPSPSSRWAAGRRPTGRGGSDRCWCRCVAGAGVTRVGDECGGTRI